ncbi:DUF4097 family beta strand repeat-containing protein [candidate division KSB1 bacterium]
MKRLTFIILTVFLLAGIVNAQEVIEKSFTVKKGEWIDINIDTGGSVEIEGWDKDEVFISARERYRDLEDYDIEISQKSRGVYIEVYEAREWDRRRRNNRSDLRFEIKVPKEFNVRVETMGGSIRLTQIDGEFRGKTMGGDLELRNLKGDVSLTTMGGAVEVVDCELDGDVSTMGGQVLIEDVVGDLDASSMGGNVIHRNVTDKSGRSTGKEVRIKTMGGPIRVDDAPQGANVKTMGGDIRIRSAGDHVLAETMGGRVEVDELDGWIEAITYSGDITVKVVGDPDSDDKHIELESLSGDIELEVPANFSMDIDIEIEYTRRSRGRYKVETDFDLEIEESQDWERPRRWDRERRSSNRDDVKYITAKGKNEGAKNKVYLRTINGNIYLKKGR